jgi:hypothetical protein
MVLLSWKLCRVRSKPCGATWGDEYQAHHLRSIDQCLRFCRKKQQKGAKDKKICKRSIIKTTETVSYLFVDGGVSVTSIRCVVLEIRSRIIMSRALLSNVCNSWMLHPL